MRSTISFPFVHDVSHTNTSEPSKSEKQTKFSGKLSAFAWRLAGLVILNLCRRKHGWILVSHDTVKGVACETMGQNPGEFPLHDVPGCMIDTKSQKNMFSRISGPQKCHLILLAFLLCKWKTLKCQTLGAAVHVIVLVEIDHCLVTLMLAICMNNQRTTSPL